MANYSLQINSTFRPYSFQEYVQPLLMAQQRHDQLEDTLAQYDSKAAEFLKLANNATDQEEIKKYKDYAAHLSSVADSLSSYGLKGLKRGQMWQIKQMYNNEITPLINAGVQRANQVKEQRLAQMQNPSLMFSRDAATTSLRDYTTNPNLSYDSLSGNQLMAMSAQAAAKLATTDRETLLKHITPYQYEYLKKNGFTMDAVNAVIAGSPNASQILMDLRNRVAQTAGLDRYSKDIQDKAKSYIDMGLYQAIGQTQTQVINDIKAQSDLQLRNSMTLQEQAHQNQKDLLNYQYTLQAQAAAAQAAAAQAAQGMIGATPNYTERNVLTDAEKQANANDWEKLKDLVYQKDGRWYAKHSVMAQIKKEAKAVEDFKNIEKEGIKFSDLDMRPSVSGGGTTITIPKTPTLDMIKRLGLQGMFGLQGNKIRRGGWQDNKINSIRDTYYGRFDATKATEFTRAINSSDYDNVLSFISQAANDKGDVYEYKRVKDKNGYQMKSTSSKINVRDLKNTDIQSAISVYGKHGNYIEIKTKGTDTSDGKVIRLPMASINHNVDALITGNMGTLQGLLDLRKAKGSNITVPYANGIQVPINDAITMALNAAGDNAIGMFETSKTKSSEVERNFYGQ